MKRKSAIFISVVALVLGLGLFGCDSFMSEREDSACRNLDTLVNMMKAPDTFVLRGNVISVTANDQTNYAGEYTFINYSSANSYGTPLRGAAMFKNHQYMCDLNDNLYYDPNRTAAEHAANDEKLATRIAYENWRQGEEGYVGEELSGKNLQTN